MFSSARLAFQLGEEEEELWRKSQDTSSTISSSERASAASQFTPSGVYKRAESILPPLGEISVQMGTLVQKSMREAIKLSRQIRHPHTKLGSKDHAGVDTVIDPTVLVSTQRRLEIMANKHALFDGDNSIGVRRNTSVAAPASVEVETNNKATKVMNRPSIQLPRLKSTAQSSLDSFVIDKELDSYRVTSPTTTTTASATFIGINTTTNSTAASPISTTTIATSSKTSAIAQSATECVRDKRREDGYYTTYDDFADAPGLENAELLSPFVFIPSPRSDHTLHSPEIQFLPVPIPMLSASGTTSSTTKQAPTSSFIKERSQKTITKNSIVSTFVSSPSPAPITKPGSSSSNVPAAATPAAVPASAPVPGKPAPAPVKRRRRSRKLVRAMARAKSFIFNRNYDQFGEPIPPKCPCDEDEDGFDEDEFEELQEEWEETIGHQGGCPGNHPLCPNCDSCECAINNHNYEIRVHDDSGCDPLAEDCDYGLEDDELDDDSEDSEDMIEEDVDDDIWRSYLSDKPMTGSVHETTTKPAKTAGTASNIVKGTRGAAAIAVTKPDIIVAAASISSHTNHTNGSTAITGVRSSSNTNGLASTLGLTQGSARVGELRGIASTESLGGLSSQLGTSLDSLSSLGTLLSTSPSFDSNLNTSTNINRNVIVTKAQSEPSQQSQPNSILQAKDGAVPVSLPLSTISSSSGSATASGSSFGSSSGSGPSTMSSTEEGVFYGAPLPESEMAMLLAIVEKAEAEEIARKAARDEALAISLSTPTSSTASASIPASTTTTTSDHASQYPTSVYDGDTELHALAKDMGMIGTDNILARCPGCRLIFLPEPRTWNPSMSEVLDNGQPVSTHALQHKCRYRFRCSCEKDFCVLCKTFPYHNGYTCEEFEASKHSVNCRFCDTSISPDNAGGALYGILALPTLQELDTKFAPLKIAGDPLPPPTLLSTFTLTDSVEDEGKTEHGRINVNSDVYGGTTKASDFTESGYHGYFISLESIPNVVHNQISTIGPQRVVPHHLPFLRALISRLGMDFLHLETATSFILSPAFAQAAESAGTGFSDSSNSISSASTLEHFQNVLATYAGMLKRRPEYSAYASLLFRFACEQSRFLKNSMPQASLLTLGISPPVTAWSNCKDGECTRRAMFSCKFLFPCGHYCVGTQESTTCANSRSHLGCLVEGCEDNSGFLLSTTNTSTNTKTTPGAYGTSFSTEDFCSVCYTEALSSAPCVRPTCGHVMHVHCVEKSLTTSSSVPHRVSFDHLNCPTCKSILHIDIPRLGAIVAAGLKIRDALVEDGVRRIEREGLDAKKELVDPSSRFFQNPQNFILEKAVYYRCGKCTTSYFGGMRNCEAALGADVEGEDGGGGGEQYLCPACSFEPGKSKTCKIHQTTFIQHKCRYCCNIATWYCFGTTHFCDSCHQLQMKGKRPPLVPCPAQVKIAAGAKSSGQASYRVGSGGKGKRLKVETSKNGKESGSGNSGSGGDENVYNLCPLGMSHPPPGSEFAIGCSACVTGENMDAPSTTQKKNPPKPVVDNKPKKYQRRK